MSRSLHIYARDARGNALPNTSFRLLSCAGILLGQVIDSHGQATFELDGPRESLCLEANHETGGQTALLGPNTDSWIFRFETSLEPLLMDLVKAHIPAVIGLLLLGVSLALAFTFADPSPLQSQLIRSTTALGMGGVASILTGMIKAKVTLGKQLAVTATGAAAVYVITYFFAPA